jgi:DnaK suppressor protein
MLQSKRAELLEGIAARQDRLLADGAGDYVDQAQRLLEQQVEIQSVRRLSATLHAVEGALREIEQGTFGRCAGCDRPIPAKRLEVMPWSPYCLSCQEYAELAQLGQPVRGLVFGELRG